MKKPKAIMFDVFGTLIDMSGVPKEELREYGRHIRKPEWSPLVLPESWQQLPAFPDSAEGVRMLRDMGLYVVTCANGPKPLLQKLLGFNRITPDYIVPLEVMQVFKPSPQAYLFAAFCTGRPKHEVMMVTANVPGLGDLEVAAKLGMMTQAIRQPDCGPQTVIELAEELRK